MPRNKSKKSPTEQKLLDQIDAAQEAEEEAYLEGKRLREIYKKKYKKDL